MAILLKEWNGFDLCFYKAVIMVSISLHPHPPFVSFLGEFLLLPLVC